MGSLAPAVGGNTTHTLNTHTGGGKFASEK